MHPSDDVLDFWFGDLDDSSALGEHPKPKTWWKKSDEFDAEIERRFGGLIDAAARGELDDWRADPARCLALVLVFDQFRRNVYRDDPRAFELDPTARVIARAAIDAGHDVALPLVRRCFFYLPLMHSESLDDHALATRCFEQLIEDARTKAPQQVSMFENNLDFEHRHRTIIERFGRYPHRNAVLGRASTDEELAFLEQPGSSF